MNKYKEITFSNSAFLFVECELIDELTVIDANNEYPCDILDLRPEITHNIAVAIQCGNAGCITRCR